MTLPTPKLPTRRDEAWRYADLKSLESVWPQLDGPEKVVVAAGDTVTPPPAKSPNYPLSTALALSISTSPSATMPVSCSMCWRPAPIMGVSK